MKAIIVSIGDEVLIGQIVNTNAAWMGKVLNDVGIEVIENIVISDTSAHITTTLDHALSKADIILTTGGLGPTKDDLTTKTLAQYFGAELVLQEEVLERLKQMLEQRGRELTEQNQKVALVPKDCKVILNPKGTAPALWFERNGKSVIAMPGVPYEMKDFMTKFILPEFERRGVTQSLFHKTIMTAGTGETVLAEHIKDIEAALPPHIKLAFLPRLGIVRLRLSGKGDDKQALEVDVNEYAQQIVQKIPKYVYGYDEKPLAAAVGDLLLERNATLSVAESCTGGYISQQIVQNAGSSAYYEGGIIAYSYELKSKLLGVSMDLLNTHGAVSQEAVEAMAKGAIERMGTDYAIATSGIAGPGGGMPDKPVGTIWMATASKTEIFSKKYQFTPYRDINIPLSANMALNGLRRFMLRELEEVSLISFKT